MSAQNNNQPPEGGHQPPDATNATANVAAGSASTSNVPLGTQISVPSVPLQDSTPLSWSVPENGTNDPGVDPPGEAAYSRGNVFNPGTGIINFLGQLQGSMKYPVRDSIRNNQDQEVRTNHFEITIDPNTTFYEYRIIGIADSERRNAKKRYVQTLIDNVPALQTNGDFFATDYIDTIISWKDLHSIPPGPKVNTYDPTIPNSGDEWRVIDIVDRNVTYHLNLRLIGTVNIAEFQNYVGSTHNNPVAFNPEPVRRALHIITTKCVHNPGNIIHLNANKFFVTHAFTELRGNGDHLDTLRAIRGYYYKIKPGMGKILLNVNPVTSVFWNPHSLDDVIRFGLNAVDGDMYALKGVQVYITYNRGKNAQSGVNDEHSRIKRIRGFGESLDTQEFTLDIKDAQDNVINTQDITVADYLEQSRSFDSEPCVYD